MKQGILFTNKLESQSLLNLKPRNFYFQIKYQDLQTSCYIWKSSVSQVSSEKHTDQNTDKPAGEGKLKLPLPPPWGSAASPGLSSGSLFQRAESQSTAQRQRPRLGSGRGALCRRTLCRRTGDWEEERHVSSQKPGNQATMVTLGSLFPKLSQCRPRPPQGDR